MISDFIKKAYSILKTNSRVKKFKFIYKNLI